MNVTSQSHTRLELLASGLVAVISFATPFSSFGQLLYEQRFNDEHDIELLEGAQIGPAGSGISGKTEDRAYTADSSVSPNARAVIPPLAEDLETDELTVTAWYKPRNPLAASATLYSAFSNLLIWDPDKKWTWRIETPSSNPYWFVAGKSPAAAWDDTADWTFIALVWKRDGDQVLFFQGDKNSGAILARETSRPGETKPLKIAGKASKTIGNDRVKFDRAFDGEIDNVRFFTKALDEQSIESIRSTDLANKEINLPAP